MAQKSQSHYFWILGGIILLIFSVSMAPLRGILQHSHSDLAQHLAPAVIPIMRAAGRGGIIFIIIGLMLPILQSKEPDGANSSWKKKISAIFLFLGLLPVLIYPFIVLADAMSLAASQSENANTLSAKLGLGFLYGTLAYPAVYIPCSIFSRMALKKKKEAVSLWFSTVPILYLIILIGFVIVGLKLDK